jgi:nucleoid-associated protein YgaU
MTVRNRYDFHVRRVASIASAGALLVSVLGVSPASAVTWPVTPKQRSTAQQVAQTGVPLSELAPNAPDQYTVKRRDTLWDISKLFLKSPWRWPELWGMNLDQIRNPHLIYPGQVLYLDKTGGRARLRVGQGPDGTVKLSPKVRGSGLDAGAISSIPFHLIEPFLNEAVIFQANELDSAPRIVAAPEGRVLMGRGDTAYVRGDLSSPQREYRVFREAKPLLDPTTNELLGYEAAYVGTAEYIRPGDTIDRISGKAEIIPATFTLTNLKQEAGVGDRLAAVPPPQFSNYTPHAPSGPMAGQIVSIYGEGLNAGQNHIVSLNKGSRDGMERGHVLALWRAGAETVDTTDSRRPTIKLPDERHGTLFVFRVFDRMSYALIMSVQEPVRRGDRFTEP